MKSSVRFMERALSMWWELSRRRMALIRHTDDHDALVEVEDEIDVLADMTDWPRLKSTIRKCVPERDAA